MDKLHIIGHQNPDTDAICSALVYQSFLRKKGIECEAYKLGELNNETKFVLEQLHLDAPKTISKLDNGSNLVLLDHNESKQSIENLENYSIYQVIDHHKFSFETKDPLYIRAEPIGSTCSILCKMFDEEGIEISKDEAIMMISAIISDTLYFRSPTTTFEDKELLHRLNEIAQIEDVEKYSLDMFAAKSDLGNISPQELVKTDYKEFEFGSNTYGLGVMETTSPSYGINRYDEIKQALIDIQNQDNLKGCFLSIVDILEEKNYTIYSDDNMRDELIKAFNATEENNILHLGNILSRKKQIVPKLKESIEN